MSTSLIVNTADYQSGKLQQMTFTGVNPDAKNSALQTFGEMTAALSKDSFVKAVRVDQKDLNLTRSARNISSVDVRNSSNSYSVADTDDNTNFTLNWKVSDVPGTSVIVRIFSPSDFANDNVLPVISRNFNSINKYYANRFEVNFPFQKVAQTFEVEVSFRETDTLLAKTIHITINVTEE